MATTLLNREGRTAVELYRCPQFSRIIRYEPAHMRVERLPIAVVDEEFKRRDDIPVERAAIMFLGNAQSTTIEARKALAAIIRESQTKEQRMKTIDVKGSTTAQLLAFYNENSGKDQVKRFSDRQTAERRVEALLAANAMATTAKQIINAAEAVNAKETEVKAKNAKKAAKKKQRVMSGRTNKAWDNKDPAERRAIKHHVVADGVEYRSVLAAFQALKLPVSKHIKFRGDLKSMGTATFEGHRFKLVE